MSSEDRYHTAITVRGYELDSYGHVNNAVYMQYFEQARWEYMRDAGLLERITDDDLMLVVTEATIKYIRETKLFDEIVIETFAEREDPFVIFRQRMWMKEDKLSVSRAKVKTIFLDNLRKPVDIPDFVREIIKKEKHEQ